MSKHNDSGSSSNDNGESSGGDGGGISKGSYMGRRDNNTLFTNYLDTKSTLVYAMRIGTLNMSADVRQLIHLGQKNTIYIVPIPDGVSPYVNEAQMPRMRGINRLYVYASAPMDKRELDYVASQYIGSMNYNYPKLSGDTVNGIASARKFPTCNFFIRNNNSPDNDFYSLIEVRWFRQRNHKANKFYDETHGTTSALVPPENHPIPKVLIMPYDYRSVSPKQGYFFNPNSNLIVHIFSKCYMVCLSDETSGIDGAATASNVWSAVTTGVIYDKQQQQQQCCNSDFVPVYVNRDDSNNIDSRGYYTEDNTAAGTLVKVPVPVDKCINSTNILDNKYLLRYVKYLFSRLGFYQVYATNSNTLVAQDHHCALVVGDYSTVSL